MDQSGYEGLWWPSPVSARAHTLQQDGPLEERIEQMGNIENQLILKFHVYWRLDETHIIQMNNTGIQLTDSRALPLLKS